MVAYYHCQIWNAAEPAHALAVNESTGCRYLDLMRGVFMVWQLPTWFENLGKCQVGAPKVYSGLLHALLGVPNQHDFEHHPKPRGKATRSGKSSGRCDPTTPITGPPTTERKMILRSSRTARRMQARGCAHAHPVHSHRPRR